MSPDNTLRSVHVDTERTWGGGQRQVAWLAAGLARRGHPTWVLARRGSRYAEALRGRGVEVVPLDPLTGWDVVAALVVSQRVCEVLLASGVEPDRVCVVHSGVDLTRPTYPAEPGTLRVMDLDPGSPVAVMVSALVPPHKDPATFVRALAAARRDRPDLQGLTVEGGPILLRYVAVVPRAPYRGRGAPGRPPGGRGKTARRGHGGGAELA